MDASGPSDTTSLARASASVSVDNLEHALLDVTSSFHWLGIFWLDA